MLMQQTINQLGELRMHTFVRMLRDQLANPASSGLSFEERLTLLVDAEWTQRQQRALDRRIKVAKLRDAACLEDIDYEKPRSLDKSVLARLATCQWVSQHQNIIITGPTGVGKTYLLCALSQKACREGYSVAYHRTSRLADALRIARADGSLERTLRGLAKADVLVLDDWGLAPLDASVRYDLMEVLEDRCGLRATLIASQLPVDDWHAYIGDLTLADAMVDRIVSNAHRLNLTGRSMR